MKRNAKWLRASAAVLVAGLIPALALAASEQGKKGAKEPAKAAPAQDANSKKLAELDKGLADARKAFEEKLKAADSDAEKKRISKEERPEQEYVGKYQELAKEAKGTEVAAKALKQVMLLAGRGDAAKEAAKTMAEEHIGSPEAALLVFAAEALLGKEEGPKVVESLKAKNKTKPVVAAFLYMDVQEMSQKQGEDADGLLPAYERMAKEFKDVTLPWSEETYGGIADGWLFVKNNLSVGKVAPGFEAVDENGVKWKLEEYRGKVVVLDFWGEW